MNFSVMHHFIAPSHSDVPAPCVTARGTQLAEMCLITRPSCDHRPAVLGLAERRGGAPIRDGLLAATIEHLLSIDVEIRWEDIVDVPTGKGEGGEGAIISDGRTLWMCPQVCTLGWRLGRG